MQTPTSQLAIVINHVPHTGNSGKAGFWVNVMTIATMETESTFVMAERIGQWGIGETVGIIALQSDRKNANNVPYIDIEQCDIAAVPSLEAVFKAKRSAAAALKA
jgi:hypothetical protein